MTKEEWKYVEDQMHPFGRNVKLKCDDIEIALNVRASAKLSYSICVYVKQDYGKFVLKGNELEEIQKKVWNAKKSYLYKAKTRQEVKASRKLSKMYKEHKMDIDKSFYVYSPFFSSFKTLKNTLIKNNKSIELMEEENA